MCVGFAFCIGAVGEMHARAKADETRADLCHFLGQRRLLTFCMLAHSFLLTNYCGRLSRQPDNIETCET